MQKCGLKYKGWKYFYYLKSQPIPVLKLLLGYFGVSELSLLCLVEPVLPWARLSRGQLTQGFLQK